MTDVDDVPPLDAWDWVIGSFLGLVATLVIIAIGSLFVDIRGLIQKVIQ